MFLNDPFSLWLEIKRIEEKEGAVVLELTVREEMLNGFGIAHGGITYSLADSALAFSANGYGIQSVSIETFKGVSIETDPPFPIKILVDHKIYQRDT